ncbi:MAG: hypothetical protein ACOYOH_14410 [Paracraurococcus sp.]
MERLRSRKGIPGHPVSRTALDMSENEAEYFGIRSRKMSDPVTPPAVPPEPDRGCPGTLLSPAAIDYVERLQRDGRQLLSFITRRSDRTPIPSGTAAGQMPPIDLLLADPRRVAGDRDALGKLVGYVDILSRRAWPASISSINITAGYLKPTPQVVGTQPGARKPEAAGDAPLLSSDSAQVRRQAASLRATIKWVRRCAIFAAGLSILLLMHIDDGRRAVQQSTAVRADLDAIYADLAKLDADKEWFFHPDAAGNPPAQVERAFVPYCKPRLPALRGTTEPDRVAHEAAVKALLAKDPWREPRTALSNAACGRLGQLQVREDIVSARLAIWNARNEAILPQYWFAQITRWIGERFGWPAPAIPGGPDILWPTTVAAGSWQQTEFRTNSSVAVLSGYVLPMLLGCIGGCVHALRRVNDKLATWTLEELDGAYSVLRVLLATTLGGLLGLIWNAETPVQVGGFSLSLAAVAFFIGFSLEVVFDVIDAMVRGASDKLRGPAKPPADLPNGTPAQAPAGQGG